LANQGYAVILAEIFVVVHGLHDWVATLCDTAGHACYVSVHLVKIPLYKISKQFFGISSKEASFVSCYLFTCLKA